MRTACNCGIAIRTPRPPATRVVARHPREAGHRRQRARATRDEPVEDVHESRAAGAILPPVVAANASQGASIPPEQNKSPGLGRGFSMNRLLAYLASFLALLLALVFVFAFALPFSALSAAFGASAGLPASAGFAGTAGVALVAGVAGATPGVAGVAGVAGLAGCACAYTATANAEATTATSSFFTSIVGSP